MPLLKTEIQTAYKDPDDALDYVFDYARWLRTGETIASSQWIQTSGIDSLTISASAFTDTETQTRIAGGTVGEVYRVTNRITLNDGQIKDTSIELTIEER